MGLPEHAGAVIVDLRRVGRLPGQPAWTVVGLLAVLGIVFGSADGWKIVAFFVAPVVVTTWLILHAFRMVRVVCEHGLVVRDFVRSSVVPWSQVHGLQSRDLRDRAGSFRQYRIDAGGRPIQLPRALRGRERELVARALQAIEQRAHVTLAAQR